MVFGKREMPCVGRRDGHLQTPYVFTGNLVMCGSQVCSVLVFP